jgi:hypothetical protein
VRETYRAFLFQLLWCARNVVKHFTQIFKLLLEDNIQMDLQEVGCGVQTGSSWLRIETGGGHL